MFSSPKGNVSRKAKQHKVYNVLLNVVRQSLLRSLHLTPTPKVQAWPGTWKSRCFGQNKNFRFLTHSRDLGAILPPNRSYGRCASFLFSRNHEKIAHGSKKEAHDSKKSWYHFSGKKSACGNVGAHPGLPEIWGQFFWKKKSACGNVGGHPGLPEIWESFF